MIHLLIEETRTTDLPVIKKEGKYHSEKEYLNTYFRLLREECFHKLKNGVSHFLSKGKCDSKEAMMYRWEQVFWCTFNLWLACVRYMKNSLASFYIILWVATSLLVI